MRKDTAMSILRHVKIEERNRLQGREEKNKAIYDRFFQTFPDPGRVFIYVDFRAEVETRKIIETLLQRDIPVAAPKMFGLDPVSSASSAERKRYSGAGRSGQTDHSGS